MVRVGLARLGELAKSTGAFASGRSYVQRYFPPGYRDPALKVIRAFEQAATGAGLYQIYQELANPNNDSLPPIDYGVRKAYKKKPYKQSKAYSRRKRRTYVRGGKCSCAHCRRRRNSY